jgi:hypothetical protein
VLTDFRTFGRTGLIYERVRTAVLLLPDEDLIGLLATLSGTVPG